MSTATDTSTVKPTTQEQKKAEQIIAETAPDLAKLLVGNKIVGFTPEQFETLKNLEQKKIEALEKEIGVWKSSAEKLIERFTPKDKIEEAKSAVEVNNTKSNKKIEFMQGAADHLWKVLKRETASTYLYKMDLHDYLIEHGYDPNLDTPEGRVKDSVPIPRTEALTTGTNPINYVRRVLLLPGGRAVTPIRQFTDYQIKGEGNAEVAWYNMDEFEFGAMSAGSAPSESASTITQVKGAPSMRGAYLKLDYDKVEDNAFPLVAALNEIAMRAAIRGEAKEILDTIQGAATPGTGKWKNGNSGATITSDDTSGMTLTITAVSTSKSALDSSGYADEGPYVLALRNKAYNELLISSGIDKFTQQGVPQVTQTGILQSLLGVQLVAYEQVTAFDNTTNDTYRNVMFVPGRTFGLASGRELTIAVEPHSELSQFYWVPSHRIAGKIKDNESFVRISTAQ